MDALPRPRADVVFQELEGETVLVHLRTNQIYAMNETAGRFWQLLGDTRDRDEVERRLLQEFDVTAEQLHEEIDELLARLVTEELVS